MAATPEQINHIKEHQAAFDSLHLGPRGVDGYFHDYGHIEDLYERVCSDLGIEPRDDGTREKLAKLLCSLDIDWDDEASQSKWDPGFLWSQVKPEVKDKYFRQADWVLRKTKEKA